ncbi:MAG: glycosyl hydrolase family 28-related protein [Candidatus Dormibacteria bacterium]
MTTSGDPCNGISRLYPGRRAFLTKGALGTGLAAAALAGFELRRGPLIAAAAGTAADSYYNVKEFGAQGNGVTDDTVAIQLAIDTAGAAGGGVVLLPVGRYPVSSPLRVTMSNVGIQGVGIGSVIVGTASDGDIIFAGSDTMGASPNGLFFDSFVITASVVKTSGSGFHGQYAQNFTITNVHAHHMSLGPPKLYDAFTLQFFGAVQLSRITAIATHTGLTMAGEPDQSWGADLRVSDGSGILFCKTGVHIGGSCGGISFTDTSLIVNGDNVVLDSSISGATNREIFFDTCFLDYCTGDNVRVKPGGANMLHFNNTWVASAQGDNIHVEPSGITGQSVIIDGCRIFNAAGSGILAYSGSWTITGTAVEFNGLGASGGYGVGLFQSFVGEPVANLVLSGNNVRQNGAGRPLGVGVYIGSGIDRYLVTSNLIVDNGTAQLVEMGGPHKLVKDNLTE